MTRCGLIRVTPELLQDALHLSGDVSIIGVAQVPDFHKGEFWLKVSGSHPSIPFVREAELIPEVEIESLTSEKTIA